MMRTMLLMLSLGGLSACMQAGPLSPADPNSPQARAARDAALEGAPPAGQPLPLPDAITGQPVTPEGSQPDDLAAQTAAALAATGGAATAPESNRAGSEVVAPATAPQLPSGTQPSIVDFALQTTNPRGARLYSRSGIDLQAKAQKNCARYASPDMAQAAFLQAGGPQQDRLSLDPDGDGYACSWDPAPYRRAVQN